MARVGDALSARFIALHQSLLDQGWQAARHMELFPLEDASAATSSMVLATRKHSKLVDRVQGKGGSSWPSWPKGRGKGKSEWTGGGDQQTKGKKGKGGNKGKNKSGGWQSGEKGAVDWSKNQEKAEGAK